MDGLFEGIEEDTDPTPTNPNTRLRFHEATALTPQLLERLQHTVRKRVLRHFRRHGLPEPHEAKILPPPRIHRHRYHGIFAPNAPLRPLVTAWAQEDSALAAQLSGPGLPLPATPSASPPKSEAPAPQPPDTAPSWPSKWATLLARWAPTRSVGREVFPLVCPTCQTPLTFIAFLTDPEPITQILVHIGELTSPPLLHPARGPPQTELDMGRAGGEAEEAAQGSFPDDLDPTPEFDPADPEPVPEDVFDQSWGA